MRWLALLLVATLLFPRTAAAQDATPDAFPVTPDPAECQIPPRTAADLMALSTQSLSHEVIAEQRLALLGPSEPAPAAAIAGVTQTARELIACLNAGDDARYFGLVSETLLTQTRPDTNHVGEPPEPRSPGRRASLLAVIEPRVFADGRVGAVVTSGYPYGRSPIQPEYLIFKEDGTRWLVDDYPIRFASPLNELGAPITPLGADHTSLVPDPAECQTSPRDRDDLIALDASDGPGPGTSFGIGTPGAGEPASTATVDAITATVREVIACLNANQPLRAAALYTDALIADSAFSVNLLIEEDQPSPLPAERRTALVGLSLVQIFADGRAGAVVSLDLPGNASPVDPGYYLFTQVGGRWRIADYPEITLSGQRETTSPSTPVAGTQPSATPAAFPLTPDPAECQTTPRTAAELATLAPAEHGTPIPAADARRRSLRGPSEPAPADAIAGVEATAREFAACLSTGDLTRLLGLYSDDLIAGIGITSDQLDDQSNPPPDGQRTALLAVIEPRIFADGRVGAIVIIDDPRTNSPAEPEFLVFVERDGRWLIDDLPVYFPAPAADGATPEAGQGGDRGWGMSVPDPSECRIAARDFDDLIALEGTPDFGPGSPDRPAPPAWPESEAADAESVAGIVRTARELTACGNAGEPLRAAALYTDGFISDPYLSLDLPRMRKIRPRPARTRPGRSPSTTCATSATAASGR